jgi:hypothetical protein
VFLKCSIHLRIKQTVPKPSDVKGADVVKNSKGTNTSSKNTGMTFPCGHSCKLEEELKSGIGSDL